MNWGILIKTIIIHDEGFVSLSNVFAGLSEKYKVFYREFTIPSEFPDKAKNGKCLSSLSKCSYMAMRI